MEIEFYGVRGSIATAGAENLRYGGNTSCVSVRAAGRQLVFDAGTGIRPLGRRLNGIEQVDLFFSHLHWDHIQGFPFFGPAYNPKATINVRAIAQNNGENNGVGEVLASQMRPPTFPVGLEVMGGTLEFEDVPQGEIVRLGEVEVRHAAVDHPNGCFAYRVDHGGRSVVYATDLEHGKDINPALAQLCEHADVLIYDAMYTPEEYEGEVGPPRHGWGHSTFEAGARLADHAKVRQLVLFHHDPSHDDGFMDALRERARKRRPSTEVAREGMTITL
jgi:phosphoribosyl 1,2-cyclic phosphodiesterase